MLAVKVHFLEHFHGSCHDTFAVDVTHNTLIHILPRPLELLRSFRPQLHPMPPRNLLLKHLVHKPMLLNHAQSLELRRLNRNGVHGATAPAYILDLCCAYVSVMRVCVWYDGSIVGVACCVAYFPANKYDVQSSVCLFVWCVSRISASFHVRHVRPSPSTVQPRKMSTYL
jgi:hypothetical protein